jgi:hypothetical protein
MDKAKKVTVTFHPQAWQNDYAIPVDPQGPTTWLVPVEKLKDIERGTYDSDRLRLEDEAPEWCREWSGPFEVTWDEGAVR